LDLFHGTIKVREDDGGLIEIKLEELRRGEKSRKQRQRARRS